MRQAVSMQELKVIRFKYRDASEGDKEKKNKDPSVQVNSSVKLNGSCHNRFGILYKAGEEEGRRVSYGEFVSIGREECRNLS